MFGGLEVAALTYGWSSFAYAYGIAQTTMAAGLLRGPGSWDSRLHKLLRSPVIAGGLTLLSSFALGLAKPWFLGMGMTTAGVSFGAIAALGVAGYFAGRVIARMNSSNNIYQRGTVILDEAQTEALKRKRGKGLTHAPGLDTTVTIAGIPLTSDDKDRPLQVETQHFKFVGITGAGKTTAIQELLDTAFARGDRAIIADPDGVYSNRYYDPSRGDVIFNPFDPRSRQWNIFSEIRNEEDIEQLARALIPDTGSTSDLIWHEHARTFLSDVVRQLRRTPEVQTEQSFAPDRATTKELYRTITQDSVKELRHLLKDTSSEPLLDRNNSRMFGSVRAIASSAVRSLKYIAEQKDAQPLSVRDWVSQGKAGTGPRQGGVLFIPYKAGEIAALRSTISAWMRLGIFEVMDKPEGDQRLWFVVDELGALGKIDGLTDALTRIRKFGGRVVLGFQSIDQVEGIYGKNDASAMVENCGNTLVLRCGTGEHGGTARFASELIGQREMLRITSSTTRQPGALFSSTSYSEHYHTEYAVMPSEIEQLGNLHGYLRIGSRPEWMQVRVEKARAPPPRAPSMAASAGAAPFVTSTATDESNLMSTASAPDNSNPSQASNASDTIRVIPLKSRGDPYYDPRENVALDSSDRVLWTQRGREFRTGPHATRESVESMIVRAREEGIRHIKLDPKSSQRFGSAVFDAALREDIDVGGYTPTPAQRLQLHAHRAAAQAAANTNNTFREAGIWARMTAWLKRNLWGGEAAQPGTVYRSGPTADVYSSDDYWPKENSIRAETFADRGMSPGKEADRGEQTERSEKSDRSDRGESSDRPEREQFQNFMRKKAAEAVARVKVEREQGAESEPESESPFERRGDSFYEKATGKLAFEKRGGAYFTSREDSLAVGGIVEELGKSTSKPLILDGSRNFMRQAWIESSVRGYDTRGYSVRDGDMEALHERFEERKQQAREAQARKAGGSIAAGKDNEKGAGTTAGAAATPAGGNGTGAENPSASDAGASAGALDTGQDAERSRTKHRIEAPIKLKVFDELRVVAKSAMEAGKSPEEVEKLALKRLSELKDWDTRETSVGLPKKAPSPSQAFGWAETLGLGQEFNYLNPEYSGTARSRPANQAEGQQTSADQTNAQADTATPKDTLGVHVAHPPASAGAGSAVKTLDPQESQAVIAAAKQNYQDSKPPQTQNSATASTDQRLDNSR